MKSKELLSSWINKAKLLKSTIDGLIFLIFSIKPVSVFLIPKNQCFFHFLKRQHENHNTIDQAKKNN